MFVQFSFAIMIDFSCIHIKILQTFFCSSQIVGQLSVYLVKACIYLTCFYLEPTVLLYSFTVLSQPVVRNCI